MGVGECESTFGALESSLGDLVEDLLVASGEVPRRGPRQDILYRRFSPRTRDIPPKIVQTRNLYEQEREASYRGSVCFRVGWKREQGESQSRREDYKIKERNQSVTRSPPVRERGRTIARGHEGWSSRA